MIKNSTGKHRKRERGRAGTVNGGWSGWLRISSLLYVFIDSLFVAFEAKMCFPLWVYAYRVRQRRSHTGRPFFVKFDRVNNNIGHYIIWYLQGLCDNRLVAWLAWCKVLLAEFLYRYGVWQHSVLRERWGCWIKVMQTDRVSWNMKPGRWNLSEKKKNECTVRVWGWVRMGGGGGGGGVQRQWWETQMRLRHKNLVRRMWNAVQNVNQ